MTVTGPIDPFWPGAYVRTTYRHHGHNDLFEIVARDSDTVTLENCRTEHTLHIPVRELHDPASWALARPAND